MTFAKKQQGCELPGTRVSTCGAEYRIESFDSLLAIKLPSEARTAVVEPALRPPDLSYDYSGGP